MVKLSVIVPVYNVEKYLEKCLISMVNQSYKDFEIIVVNDGSLDHSQEIIDRYQNQYPKKLVSLIKENGGLSDARNYGLNVAQGEYVAFVDSDDYVDLNLFEKMMEAIIQTKSEIAVCDLLYEYDSGAVKLSSGGDFITINPRTDSSTLSINNSACNKVFKRELILNKPFIKGIWYEDLATIPLIMLQANSIVKVNDVYYHYLQRESSIVHTKNIKIFDIYIALNSIKKEIDKQSIYLPTFHKMCINQAVFLTNLRIREYSEDRVEFWKMNQKRIHELYPNWYWNRYTWTQGFKQWLIFSLFNFKFFNLLNLIY